MKLIFLDIDGVMNSVADRFSWSMETDLHLKVLKSIVDATGAKIVLSSSWRYGAVSIVRERLNQFGMDLIGCTPTNLKGEDIKRGDEIRYYLEHCDEEVESFVILDDERDMREFTETNLVQTDHYIGLRTPWAEKAIAILNGYKGRWEW